MSNVTDEMVFGDLSRIEVPVKISGENYVLLEANGEIAAAYRNHAMSCTVFNSEGKPSGVRGLGDLQILLVGMCLHKSVTRGSVVALESVGQNFVRSLPERVVKPLFERAKAISELDEETDDSIIGLEKQIQELQEKLDKARKQEELLKNELPSTEGQSE